MVELQQTDEPKVAQSNQDAAATTPGGDNQPDQEVAADVRPTNKSQKDKRAAENNDDDDVNATPRSSSTKEQRDQSQRQNRGRRQPNRQEDSKNNKKQYRVKSTARPDGGDDEATGADAGDNAAEGSKRPQTTRGRRGQAAAADAEEEGGDAQRKNTTRARSTRRRRNQSLSAVIDGEAEGSASPKKRQRNKRDGGDAAKPQAKAGATKVLSKQEKERQALDKKREKMSHQYEPFTPRRTFKSRFTEYQFAEWRKRRNNTFVTVETEVPDEPRKPLEEPDDAAYHLQIGSIDEDLDKLQEEFKDLVSEQHQARSTMRDGQTGRNPIRDELRELFGELSTYNGEKKEKLAEIEGINRKMQDVNRKLEQQRKNVHPIYNEEDKLQKGVKELEHRLQTNEWSRIDEQRIIKEIEQVKASKPFFAKIQELRQQISTLKEKREEVKKALSPTNKIINSLKEKIGKVKDKESVFDKEKQLKQYDITNISTKIEKVLERTRALKQKKYELKEAFYGSMCDYEIQQAFIKDIEWISKTKQMVVERAGRAEKYRQEQRERADQRKKLAEERDKQRAEIKAKQDERRKEQDAKKAEWEQTQLAKLEKHPYKGQISLCEELIYFCAKNTKRTEDENGPDAEDGKTDSAAADDESQRAKQKRLEDAVQNGKLEVAKSKAERETGNQLGSLKQAKKSKGRKRDGPSSFYYEDESRIDLDYTTIQKFGSLQMSPPTDFEQLPEVNKVLVQIREALKLKGTIEQVEGKAKFTKDDSLVKSEEHAERKAAYAKYDANVRAKIDKVQYEMRYRKQRTDADEDDEFDDEARSPAREERPRGRRGDNERDGQQRDNRRTGNNTQRRGKRDLETAEDDEDRQPAAKKGKKDNKPREKIAGNMEAFPEL